jgi:hypothetical protein
MATYESNSIPSDGQHGKQLVERILASLEGIHFGSVEIVVHEGQVVQIERKEKLRFDSGTQQKDR